MVGVEGVSKVWLRGSWLQLEFDTHRSYLANIPILMPSTDLQHWPGDSWYQVPSGFGEESRWVEHSVDSFWNLVTKCISPKM